MFVDAEIAAHLEATYAWRCAQYALAYGRLNPPAQSTAEPLGGGWLLYGGAAAPINRAVGLGFNEPVSSDLLDQVENFYHQKGSAVRIDLCPLAQPALQEQLFCRGYRLEAWYSMLVFPLQDKEPDVPVPEDIRVEPAEADQEALWVSVVGRGFAGTREPGASPDMQEIIRPTFHSQGARLYLAWRGDQALGGGALIPYGPAAECASASTLPHARRSGVQTALLHARMQAAREAGCRYLSVVTSPGSLSQQNVQRFGFSLAYTRAVMALPHRLEAGNTGGRP